MANNSNGLLIVAVAVAAYLWLRDPVAPAPANGTGGPGNVGTGEPTQMGDTGYIIINGKKVRWSTSSSDGFSIDPGTAANTVTDYYTPVAQW